MREFYPELWPDFIPDQLMDREVVSEPDRTVICYGDGVIVTISKPIYLRGYWSTPRIETHFKAGDYLLEENKYGIPQYSPIPEDN